MCIIKTNQFIALFEGLKIDIEASDFYKQQLTHQTIHGQFININIKSPLDLDHYQLVSTDKMTQLPFPKFITTYLKD